MEIGSATDVGRRRTHNEDAILVVKDPPASGRGALCAVADGMGGHAAGEVASQTAIETLRGSYYESDSDPRAALEAAVHQANAAVWSTGNADPSRHGMGTTLVCAVVLPGKAIIANIGDSQAYLIANQSIQLVTSDHSWVAEQVTQGKLSAHQADQHPLRHVLTRSLGVASEVEVDLYEIALAPNDTLLLCSDGLSNHVQPEEIRSLVERLPPAEAVNGLVQLANERGGTDNISAVAIRV